MRRIFFLMVVLVVFSHCSEGRPPDGVDGAGQTDGRVADGPPQNRINAATPKGSGAQKAYLDPETGELIPPPEREAHERSESKSPAAKDDSTGKMAEEASPVPGGGVMVDLKGRFRKPTSATVEGTGETGPESRTGETSE